MLPDRGKIVTIEDAREVSEREDEGVKGRKGMGGRKAQRRGGAGKRAVPFLALTVRASSLSCAVGKSLYLPHAPGSSFSRIRGFVLLSISSSPATLRRSCRAQEFTDRAQFRAGTFPRSGLGRFGVGVKSSREAVTIPKKSPPQPDSLKKRISFRFLQSESPF